MCLVGFSYLLRSVANAQSNRDLRNGHQYTLLRRRSYPRLAGYLGSYPLDKSIEEVPRAIECDARKRSRPSLTNALSQVYSPVRGRHEFSGNTAAGVSGRTRKQSGAWSSGG